MFVWWRGVGSGNVVRAIRGLTSGPVSGNIASVGLYEQIYSSPSDRKKNKQKNNIRQTQKYNRCARVSCSRSCVAYKTNCKKCINIITAANLTAGNRVSLYNNLLQDTCFTRNVLHLSGIITRCKGMPDCSPSPSPGVVCTAGLVNIAASIHRVTVT